MTGLNFLLTHNVSTSQSSSGVYIVVTMVVIGLGERNAQADNRRAEMVCNVNGIKATKEQKRYRQKQHKCKKECEKEKIQKRKRQIIQKSDKGQYLRFYIQSSLPATISTSRRTEYRTLSIVLYLFFHFHFPFLYNLPFFIFRFCIFSFSHSFLHLCCFCLYLFCSFVVFVAFILPPFVIAYHLSSPIVSLCIPFTQPYHYHCHYYIHT